MGEYSFLKVTSAVFMVNSSIFHGEIPTRSILFLGPLEVLTVNQQHLVSHARSTFISAK
jgi:hypothetical protein